MRNMSILFSNTALDFVAAPALAPAEVQVDPVLIRQYEAELKQVRTHTFNDSS